MAASASRKVQQKYSRFREWQAGQTITRVVAFSDRPSSGDRRKIFQFTPFYPNASVITSKPAIRYHFKTGQRDRTQDYMTLYRAARDSGKYFFD
jgi:hypothetical protein